MAGEVEESHARLLSTCSKLVERELDYSKASHLRDKMRFLERYLHHGIGYSDIWLIEMCIFFPFFTFYQRFWQCSLEFRYYWRVKGGIKFYWIPSRNEIFHSDFRVVFLQEFSVTIQAIYIIVDLINRLILQIKTETFLEFYFNDISLHFKIFYSSYICMVLRSNCDCAFVAGLARVNCKTRCGSKWVRLLAALPRKERNQMRSLSRRCEYQSPVFCFFSRYKLGSVIWMIQ